MKKVCCEIKQKKEKEGRWQLHVSLSSNVGSKSSQRNGESRVKGEMEKKEKTSQRALCVVLLESVFCLTLAKVFLSVTSALVPWVMPLLG